jgi:DNA invertase Pin-like site-specific DNA recombinase
MSNEKILNTHLSRQAIVYARQSTLRQFHENKESLMRQLGLKARALAHGWADHRVTVIEDDVGQSGASSDWRQGFQRLAEDVAHGKVGAIFALEVSRLARSSADWHRLLELCSLADVLIADEQAVYSPRDYNDRLLLGLKGTMSEAELYWMRLRLEGGRLSKARRGELFFCPPGGYQWDPSSSRFRLDPDERVQRAIHLVFERFRLDGSAYAITRYFARAGLMLPAYDLSARQLRWASPRHTLVLSILHNPIYAGTYVFGRKQERMGLVNGKLQRRCVRKLPQEEWKSVIHDRHPAYISWEEFMANQKKLDENRTYDKDKGHRGASREGQALLQGLALCGRCGRRMSTRYQGSHHRIQYQCRPNHVTLGMLCWSVAGDKIDRAVEKLFLSAVVPKDIDLSLSLVRETKRQVQEVEAQWKLRTERLQYEAKLAERRYKAIDPDNRVVARTLEREWEEKLQELENVQREREQTLKREKAELTEQDRAQLLRLAKDLRTVWDSEITTHAERKNLVRMLIREITLSPIEVPQRMTRVQVYWQTGAVSELTVNREDKYTAQATTKETLALIRKLFEQKQSDEKIAVELNQNQMKRKVNRPWDATAVQRIRYSYGLHRSSSKSRRAPARRSDGLYSIHGISEYFEVTPAHVRSWVHTEALIPVEGGGTGNVWWFKLDDSTIKRLNELKSKRFYKSSSIQANF